MYVPTTKRDMSQGQFISYFGLFLKFKEREREKDATISPMQYAYANEYSMQKRHFRPLKHEKSLPSHGPPYLSPAPPSLSLSLVSRHVMYLSCTALHFQAKVGRPPWLSLLARHVLVVRDVRLNFCFCFLQCSRNTLFPPPAPAN